MVETIATVYRVEKSIDAEAVKHRAAEVNRLVGQDSKLAGRKPLEGFADAGIQDGAVEHVRAIVGEKHLQSGLNIGFARLMGQCSPNQHQSSVSDETGDLVLRQIRQIEPVSDVIYGGSQIFFRVHQ